MNDQLGMAYLNHMVPMGTNVETGPECLGDLTKVTQLKRRPGISNKWNSLFSGLLITPLPWAVPVHSLRI